MASKKLFLSNPNKNKIEIKISYAKSKQTMLQELNKYFDSNHIKYYDGKVPHNFIIQYLNWIKKYNIPQIYAQCIKPKVLLINKIELNQPLELPLPSGKIYHLNNGSKVMRFLQTIVKEYNSDFNIDYFKEFKLVHSLIVNAQEKTERIILSKNPDDFTEFYKKEIKLNNNTFLVYNKKKTWYDIYSINNDNIITNLTRTNPDAIKPIKEQVRLKLG